MHRNSLIAFVARFYQRERGEEFTKGRRNMVSFAIFSFAITHGSEGAEQMALDYIPSRYGVKFFLANTTGRKIKEGPNSSAEK